MAAGGSAPELFTSFIGTFNQVWCARGWSILYDGRSTGEWDGWTWRQARLCVKMTRRQVVHFFWHAPKQDAVGFGTIVGSAVFNVLLVIGVCAFCSKEVLNLVRD